MKQNRTFTFPDFRTVYSYAPLYRLQHLKYTLRKFFGKKEIYAFEQFVNASPIRQGLFLHCPQDAYPLLREFVDRRFNCKRRLDAMTADFLMAEKLFGTAILHQMEDYRFLWSWRTFQTASACGSTATTTASKKARGLYLCAMKQATGCIWRPSPLSAHTC